MTWKIKKCPWNDLSVYISITNCIYDIGKKMCPWDDLSVYSSIRELYL